MVLLAASICTRGGKPVISRQFREMSRSRIESLLSSFPKLLSSGSQHTTIETEHVRYVYQPLEDLYMILITNKNSNILQDIDTLHLFARVVADMCRSPLDERDVLRNSFELLGAFDEIASLGYRENVNLAQVRTILEMDSHEEKIQEIIERNKELEAKEELKRRAKHLEMQRREAARRGQVGGNMGGFGATSGGVGGYAPSSSGYDSPTGGHSAPVVRDTGADAAPVQRPLKGKGMQLGKKTRGADLLGAMGAETVTPAAPSAPTPVPPAAAPAAVRSRSSTPVVGAGASSSSSLLDLLPHVEPAAVHAVVKERVSMQAGRDGSLTSLEVKGDLEVRITDATHSKVKLQLAQDDGKALLAGLGGEVQYKTHPHVDKASWTSNRLISLKDPSRPFPLNQNLGVLRWRLTTRDESLIPLSITAWPSASQDGSGSGECNVAFEFEGAAQLGKVDRLVVKVPLPEGVQSEEEVAISPPDVGEANFATGEDGTPCLLWTIDDVDSSTSSGSLDFSLSSGVESADDFFPIEADFIVVGGTMSGTKVESVVEAAGGQGAPWSSQAYLLSEAYQVV